VSPLLDEARVSIHGISGAAANRSERWVGGDGVAGDDVCCGC
jgi:hypothetical protein